VREQRDLDPQVDRALSEGWPLKRVDAILRAILRAGAYELSRRLDIPPRVTITEYVDVAHAFLERDEAGMVNAVLDRLARAVRGAEL
jgi:transcription antitermination protein NusB